jgi:Fur family peroxide stress response transcriptional regulator
MVSATRFEQITEKLRLRGYRVTPQRLALIRLIVASAGHPNATSLYQQVKTDYPTMSLATVYKTLDMLKELGEVLEIDLHTDSHYDAKKPYPHPHMMCTQCGLIRDGELSEAVHDLVRDVEQNMGFQVTHHQLNFYGVCSDCRDKQHTQ